MREVFKKLCVGIICVATIPVMAVIAIPVVISQAIRS